MVDANANRSRTSSRERLLEARGVSRHVHGRALLDGVSIEVYGGDRLAVVGPTGSGKTLVLRALAMLDPLDSGTILWRGRRVHGHTIPAFRSRVIYLHQRPSLAEGSMEENLRVPFMLQVHRDKHFDRAGTISRLASLGRGEAFLAKAARDLSGGESQITALLRAMQLAPEVLMLDEPTSALDTEATQMVERFVDAWVREKPEERATIWVTHSREQAERVSNRVVAMANCSLQQVQ